MKSLLRSCHILAVVILILVPTGLWAQNGLFWIQKVPGGGLGDPFFYNPQNHNTVLGAPGNNQVWRSTDRGRTWSLFSTVSGGSQIKSICVHPVDTLQMLVGQEAGPPDRVMKTTNGGQSWFLTWGGNYSYYGRPIAYDPAHPDLVYTEGGDSLFRSTDFGSTWTFVRRTSDAGGPGIGFNAWDCAVIRPDSDMILYVGDVGNGLWKTTDRGLTWSRKHLHSGEYPIIGIDRFNPLIAYAARWGGIRGFMKTTDGGETWVDVAPLAGRNTWGMAVAVEEPGYVYTGTYGDPLGSTGGVYFSRDYGATWTRTYEGLTSGSNYAVLAVDTQSVFALQANGVWKLRFPGTIGGVLFYDSNGNGVRDPGESGLRNWEIQLGGARIDSVRTNVLGEYEFSLLGPGTYVVSPELPANAFITTPDSGNYSVVVTDGDHYSNMHFGVGIRALSLEVPNGGEAWVIGEGQLITWSSALVPGTVKIEVSRDGGVTFEVIYDSTANDSSEAWVVAGPVTGEGRIRISSVDYPTVSDISDDNFSIIQASGVFTANTDSLGYGQVAVGSSALDSVIVTNSGSAPLTVSSVVSSNIHFVVSPESVTIGPSDSRSFRISFTPSDTGLVDGYVVFTHSAMTSPDTILVSGHGVAALCRISRQNIDFGTVAVGTTQQDSFVVYDDGNMSLSVNIVSTNARFTVQPTNAVIPPADSNLFTVRFVADSLGVQTGVIVLEHNGPSSPDTIAVSADVITSVTSEKAQIPKSCLLYQNFPNPFNPSTEIVFDLPAPALIRLTIYSTLGTRVADLAETIPYPAGTHRVRYEGSHLPSGIYYCRLMTSTGFVQTRKMVLLK